MFPLIKAENLIKRYGEGTAITTALDGVSFEIIQGEFVAIMGPSGSGKSTLLHIIGFLDKETEGDYYFDGKKFDDYSPKEIANIRGKKMGFIFQMFNLLPRTSVIDNVKLPLVYSGIKEDAWDERINNAIKIVGMSHRLEFEPSQLSGGEKQRTAIARALVNNPQVIFADEPTGNLDSKSGRQVMETLDYLNREKGHTIVLITHESNTAKYAERIIHLKDGKIEKDEKVSQRFNGEYDLK